MRVNDELCNWACLEGLITTFDYRLFIRRQKQARREHWTLSTSLFLVPSCPAGPHRALLTTTLSLCVDVKSLALLFEFLSKVLALRGTPARPRSHGCPELLIYTPTVYITSRLDFVVLCWLQGNIGVEQTNVYVSRNVFALCSVYSVYPLCSGASLHITIRWNNYLCQIIIINKSSIRSEWMNWDYRMGSNWFNAMQQNKTKQNKTTLHRCSLTNIW